MKKRNAKPKKTKAAETDRMRTRAQQNKAGVCMLLAAVFGVLFIFGYSGLLKAILLQVHSPDYFLTARSTEGFLILGYPFAMACFFAVAFYFVPRKMTNKTYMAIAGSILTAVLLVTVICSCNVWVFNKGTFSYNTLFQKNKTVYTYSDIQSATLQYESRGRNDVLFYELKMSDGQEIEIGISDAACKDEHLLFTFDEKISGKRNVVGEYFDFRGLSDAFNEYFGALFTHGQPG